MPGGQPIYFKSEVADMVHRRQAIAQWVAVAATAAIGLISNFAPL